MASAGPNGFRSKEAAGPNGSRDGKAEIALSAAGPNGSRLEGAAGPNGLRDTLLTKSTLVSLLAVGFRGSRSH